VKKFEKISERRLKYHRWRASPLAHSASAILFHRGEPVALGPRAVGLLRVLVERRGVPVSKDTL
jgi:DNA-binding winged helix-turn-helix (wHTH) protein